MLQKFFNPEWLITFKSFLLSSLLIGFSFSPTAEISLLEFEFEESLPRKTASVFKREMMTFFTQRGYPLTSIGQDLRRVTTIGRPDALTGSERGDTNVNRVPLVMTYHPFNAHIKRYLLQNFRILFTDQQTQDIFP